MTIIVPEEKWENFFQDISRQNYQWETSVEIVDECVGSQILARSLPLLSIVAEGSNLGNKKIEISVGKAADGSVTHQIESPEKVAVLEIDTDIGSSIAIEDKTGCITLMHLQKPSLFFPWTATPTP